MGPLPGPHDATGKLGLSIHLAAWQQNQVIARACSAVADRSMHKSSMSWSRI